MGKSLSFFAVRHGKAAFGLEASKEFSVEVRAYYHLLLIESFLRQAGVEFTRSFALTPDGVQAALQDNLGISFADNRIFLPLDDVRPAINLLPMPREAPATAIASKPIMAVLPCAKDQSSQYCVHYGNRTVTLIRPDWRDMDQSLVGIRARVDGRETDIEFGRVLEVSQNIFVLPMGGYRVNAIGFDNGQRDESGVALSLKDFQPRFSVDKQGKLYRIEVYKGQQFSGMFLVRFLPNNTRVAKNGRYSPKSSGALPDGPGPESSLGY